MNQAAPTTEDPADPIEQLPKAVYRTIIADLYAFVPSPDLTDPELIAERVLAVISDIASMVPVNADEASFSLSVFLADAQARDCMRHARMHFNDAGIAMKCRAQASHCKRTANAARALLLRVQAARHKREAVPQSCEQDAWTIHASESYLLAADGQRVAAPPPPPSAVAPGDAGEPRHTAAETYAIMYPQRAAAIRAYGGMPPDAAFDRPPPRLLSALHASTSPILQRIDEQRTAEAAA